MVSALEELVEALDEADWFSRVGLPLRAESGDEVVTASSWDEAVACARSPEWCGVGAEQRNCLTMHLHRHAPDDFRRWSDFVGAARAAYKPVVERKLAALSGVLGNETFAAVWMDVNRCVLGACMERLYAAAAPPIFFGKLMPWYLAGRFPCGWGERRSDGAVQRLGPRDEAEFERFESNPATRLLAEHARFVDPHLRLPAFGRLIVY